MPSPVSRVSGWFGPGEDHKPINSFMWLTPVTGFYPWLDETPRQDNSQQAGIRGRQETRQVS